MLYFHARGLQALLAAALTGGRGVPTRVSPTSMTREPQKAQQSIRDHQKQAA